MRIATNSPAKYIQGWNELAALGETTSALGNSALAIVDPFVLEKYGEILKKSFNDAEKQLDTLKFNGEATRGEVDRVVAAAKDKGSEVIIGMGGGKTLDTAKAAGFYSGLPVAVVPTAASSDAPCSALAVLYKEDNSFDAYLPLKHNPDMVIVDTKIVAEAPVRLLVSGMGDALATYFEARSCRASRANTNAGGSCSLAAMSLAEACLESLYRDGYKAKLAAESGDISPALENIIETNTYLSGIGFESGGLAAAHAIHNGLTVLPDTHRMLHGEKVAFGTLVHLVLENAPMDEIEEVIDFCHSVGLPTSIGMLSAYPFRENIVKVAEASCADGDTMHNMPFKVSVKDVISAITVADKLGRKN